MLRILHRYLVRLENSRKHTSRDGFQLLIEFREKTEESGSVVKNLRVTEKAVEFDLYVPDDSSKKKALEQLTMDFGRLLNERDLQENEGTISPSLFQSKEETIKLSVDLFNEQRYWECHETMEQIWRREKNKDEKDVQQGFILAASALVHYQKNENDVCLGMIPRTLARLERWKEPKYFYLNVRVLKEKLEAIRNTRKIVPFEI